MSVFNIFSRLAVLFFILTILNGCATGSRTASLPYTTIPLPKLSIEDEIKNLKIAVVLFDIENTKISGGRHEGFMQKSEPWDLNLSQGQKDSFSMGIAETTRLAIADEFRRQGLNVIITDGKDMNRLKDLNIIVTGEVEYIELNTYNSRGNYWEAEVILKNVTFYRTMDGAMLWVGNIGEYSKLPESPPEPDLAIFTAISEKLQETIKEKVNEDYSLHRKDITPVEIAARLSAIDIIKRLKSESFIISM
jgi:hypothetical protein